MNAQRLLKLAEVLENFEVERQNLVVPLDEFSLRDWFVHKMTAPDAPGCGTVACAVGVAMLHPWFQAEGLRPSRDVLVQPTLSDPVIMAAPIEAQPFFGLASEPFWHLFGEQNYADGARTSPLEVAQRIREYVDTGAVTLPEGVE